MAAPKGNRFWELRARHGRRPIFSNPEDLWTSCCGYFEWVEDNPLKEEKVFSASDGLRRAEIAKMRAMTISGLCFFLGISRETWNEYGKKEDFSDIVREVEAVIYEQKFAGAAADLLNANIIARELGLSEKKEHSGKITLEDLLTEEDE